MSEDTRCGGSRTCIIDSEGRCWCGPQWGGQQTGLPATGGPCAAKAPEPKDEG
jgi:hypothetical protein